MKRAFVPIMLTLLAIAAVSPYAFPALARFEPHFKIVAVILWVWSYYLVVWPLRFGHGTPVRWRNLLIPWILQNRGPPLTWKDVALLSIYFTSIVAILMAEHDGQDQAPMRLGALVIFAGAFAGTFLLGALILHARDVLADRHADVARLTESVIQKGLYAETPRAFSRLALAALVAMGVVLILSALFKI